MQQLEPIKIFIKNYTYLRYSEKFLLLTMMLCIFGLLVVFSASASFGRSELSSDFYYLIRQSWFLITGIIGFLIVTRIPIYFYEKYSYLILIISFVLLTLLLIPGVGQYRFGARRWFEVFNFGVQPTELLKISLIIWLASFLKRKKHYLKSVSSIILMPLIIIAIASFLLISQPDFGTIILLLVVSLLMMYYAGLNWKRLLLLILVGVVFCWIMIIGNEYRLERINTYLNPWEDYNNSGFQITNSLIALGNGGLLGKGLGNSLQKQYYLPLAETDFVLATIAEELGFIGSTIILLIFYLITRCGIKIAASCKDEFSKFLVFGLTMLISLQSLLHIGVVSGLLPTKGIGLPFISYGGSSLIVYIQITAIVYKIGTTNKC